MLTVVFEPTAAPRLESRGPRARKVASSRPRVDTSSPLACICAPPKGLEFTVHGDLGAETTVAQVRPYLDEPGAYPHAMAETVAEHAGERDQFLCPGSRGGEARCEGNANGGAETLAVERSRARRRAG